MSDEATVTHDLSAKQIAKKYGVHARHFTQMAARGEIPCVRLGKVWRFNLEEVAVALQEGKKRRVLTSTAAAQQTGVAKERAE